MIRSLTQKQKTDLIEKLADLEHKQWGHWTRYFLESYNEDNRKRWNRQANTAYKSLSEKEKESDRVWARKVLKILKQLNLEVVSK